MTEPRTGMSRSAPQDRPPTALAAKTMTAEWVAARRGTLSASPAALYQGSGDQQTPDQEPGIPQVGMPSQGAVVGVPWRRDDARLDEQSGGSQHQAVGGQDQCLYPGQSPQPSLPPSRRAARRTDGDEREECRDGLQRDGSPDCELDRGAAGACQGRAHGGEQPAAA